MANQAESDKDQVLKSNIDTSTSAPREAGQIVNQLAGKQSTALDSTIETSTTAPRSAEQIMDEMKKEDEKKNAALKTRVKSPVMSAFNKWGAAGVNARKVVGEVSDAAKNAKDVGKEVMSVAGGNLPNIDDQRGSVLSPISAVASAAVAIGTSIYSATATTDQSEVNQLKTVPAPSDVSIISFKQHQTQAKLHGAHAKKLEYTDAQQSKWSAQDQYRMYSNYGDMYKHGQNETNYNMAILNSAMAMHAPVAKQLSPVPTFRQKFLAAIVKDDNHMDINSLTSENMFAHSADLLNIGPMKEASEDLSFVNRQGRDAHIKDKFAAIDHDLNGRMAEKENVENAFARASVAKNDKFLSNIEKRMASLDANLGLDKIQSTQAEVDNEFF